MTSGKDGRGELRGEAFASTGSRFAIKCSEIDARREEEQGKRAICDTQETSV